MRSAFLIAWREYSENAKTKGFWLGILLMPAILFMAAQVPLWLEQKATPTRHFVLVDPAGSLEPVITSSLERAHQSKVLQALRDYARKYRARDAGAGASAPALADFGDTGESPSPSVTAFVAGGGKDAYLERLRPHLRPEAPPFREPRRAFEAVPLPMSLGSPEDPVAVVEALKPYLRGERTTRVRGAPVEIHLAVVIPRDIGEQIVRPSPSGARSAGRAVHPIECWSVNAADSRLRDEIERIVNAEIRRREYLARGMDGAAIREVEQTYVPFESLDPRKEKGREAVDAVDKVKQWAPSAFVYLLWVSLFVIIQMLLNNTIEEKSNRIIEVLLSSVTPGELMIGKLFGIAAIGLTMVGSWMLALFGLLSWKAGGPSSVAGQILLVLKGSNLILLFSIYFLLGYLLYSSFILAVGSVCNTIKEAQSYMGLLTVVMMVPLWTLTFIPRDPNGALARWLSWIPIYTPFAMMNRATANPPLVDQIGTLILLAASTVLALWLTGRIFRIGILRTGQPPRILEMTRWLARRGD